MEMRLAMRSLLRRPLLSVSTALAIALALAVNTALFSVVDGLLFRPLPFVAPEELVTIDFRKIDGRLQELSYLPERAADRVDLRGRLQGSPLVRSLSRSGSGGLFDPDLARDAGLVVTGVDADFLPLFGLYPATGVPFAREDEAGPAAQDRTSGIPLPVIIGDELNKRSFGGGGTAGVHTLAGRPVRILGVMPPGAKFPGETNVWAAVRFPSDRMPTYGRLTSRDAATQLSGLFPELEITPLPSALRPPDSGGVVLLFLAAGLLLLITWVQVGGLSVSVTISRLHQIGVQLALGSGRARVWKQIGCETALIAVAALALAWAMIGPLSTFLIEALPEDLRHGQYLEPDRRSFLFATAVTLVGFAVLVAVPIRIVSSAAPLGLLSGRASAKPLRPTSFRRALVIGQLTMTAALLYVTGLAAHTHYRIATFDYGFDSEQVLLFTPPPWARPNVPNAQLHADFAERQRKVALTIERLQSIPSVESTSTFMMAPLGLGVSRKASAPAAITSFAGFPRSDLEARVNSVGRHFVRTLGARLVAGHSFDAPEYAGRTDVVVINESLARRLQPDADPAGTGWSGVLGREIASRFVRGRIVGVIKDLVDSTPAVPPDPQVFTPDHRSTGASLIAIRVEPQSGALELLRSELQAVWGPLRPAALSLLRDELREVQSPYRAQSTLLGMITAFSLPIAALGLLGAISFAVRATTRELAIRLSLGADPVMLRRRVVIDSMAGVLVAVAGGVVLGSLVAGVLNTQLFEVQPVDHVTIVGVAAAMGLLAWGAAAWPSRQILKLDPSAVLRQE